MASSTSVGGPCNIWCDIRQVRVFETMSFVRPGARDGEHSTMRANKHFRGAARRHDVKIDSGDRQEPIYYASLICFFTCLYRGRERKCAFLRWYTPFGAVDAKSGCVVVTPQTMRNTRSATGPEVPFYDVVDVAKIVDFACLRTVPGTRRGGQYKYCVNKFAQ